MKQTQIQLDEKTWRVLREKASLEKQSITELISDMIRSQLREKKKKKQYSLKEFSFVGSGRSKGEGAGSVARRHDEELSKSFLE